ncbi:MAG: glutathione S-transferase C-terminal domain-containing protein, partial [Woeseia sp.]
WLDWNQCRLAQPVMDIVFNKVFMGADADTAAIARGESQMVELADILAGTLSNNDYLAGGKPTIADLSVGSNLTQLLLAEMTMDHPVVEAWYQRLSLIPGFARSLPS